MAEQRTGAGDTRSEILDVAERLVQRRGFNDMSYADIAAEMGITKAALHYHFPGKAELGESLVTRYAARFQDALRVIAADQADAARQLEAYCAIYVSVLRDKRLCLCGMLAAEYNTLPLSMREAVANFFEENEKWLVDLLSRGRSAGTLTFNDSPEQAARMIVAALEGAMLVSRPYGNTSVIDSVAGQLVSELVPRTGRRRQ